MNSNVVSEYQLFSQPPFMDVIWTASSHGNAWQRMATHGNAWQRMATHGNAWQRMATHGKG
jgi:hypothetical protein